MTHRRWLRIIPVAFIMYTISYIDRTNISLALEPMKAALGMDSEYAGLASGIFFFGYVSLQIPGGYLAHRWSAKRLIGIFLVFWGVCAVGGGLVQTPRQFLVMRFLLGVAESAVYPATLVLLSNWFPRAERARANALWMLCQPLSVAISSPLSGWILDAWKSSSWAATTGLANWRAMLILEGALPFAWLPIWLCFIADHPRQARWISAEERDYVDATLGREASELEPVRPASFWSALLRPQVLVMVVIYFFQNCGAYGCMFWLPSALKNNNQLDLSNTIIGVLFAVPYVLSGAAMVLNARHSDRTRERRGHVAAALGWGGFFLVAAVLSYPYSLWLWYACVCLAITGPFSSLAPFWAIPTETLPRSVAGPAMGLINAMGNLGGFAGPFVVGYLNKTTGNFTFAFALLGFGLMLGAALTAFIKPAAKNLDTPPDGPQLQRV